jgi:hypothetical protein
MGRAEPQLNDVGGGFFADEVGWWNDRTVGRRNVQPCYPALGSGNRDCECDLTRRSS